MQASALRLSGVVPASHVPVAGSRMPALLAPGNAASHAFVNLPIDATQLQQLKELCDAIQPAGQHIDGHLAVRDMQIGRGGKNDSAVDLPNWPMEQHAYAPASYPNIATETNHTPGPYFLLPPHRHTCEPEPIVRGSDTTPEVPSDDMSDDVRGPESEESDFAPEGSGDEDELDFADSDYTEPGRSRRSGGGPKRKSDGAIKQPKDSKRPKMCKKPLFRTKESALLTVANEEFEQDGVPCVKFGYTNKGKQTAHIMRVDVEDIDEESFTTSFKETYCIYPKAICSRDEYKGSRWAYETEVNKIAWKLAFRNLSVFPSGQRGLLQRAVDVYRNMFTETKSRRVQRQVKNAGIEQPHRPAPESIFCHDPGPRSARRSRPQSFGLSSRGSVQTLAPHRSYSSLSIESYDMEDDDEGEEELQADEAMRRSPEPVRVLPPPPPPPVVRRFAPVTKIANGPTESKALEPYQCYEFIFDPLPDHIVEQLRRHIEAGHNGEMEALELLSEAGSYEPIVDAEYFAQLKESLSATPRAVSPLTLSVQELIDFDAIVAMPED